MSHRRLAPDLDDTGLALAAVAGGAVYGITSWNLLAADTQRWIGVAVGVVFCVERVWRISKQWQAGAIAPLVAQVGVLLATVAITAAFVLRAVNVTASDADGTTTKLIRSGVPAVLAFGFAVSRLTRRWERRTAEAAKALLDGKTET